MKRVFRPRFSDDALPVSDPQFVKATTLRHEEPHQDKIYYFFREDNPDKSPEAPRNISRVAQLCTVPQEQLYGGEASVLQGWQMDMPVHLGLLAHDLALWLNSLLCHKVRMGYGHVLWPSYPLAPISSVEERKPFSASLVC